MVPRQTEELLNILEPKPPEQDIASHSDSLALSPFDFENPGYNMVLVCEALSPCPYRGPRELYEMLQLHQREH